MSITYPPEMLPIADEAADVWVKCPCGCTWDPSMLAACPVCDEPKNLDAQFTLLQSENTALKDALERICRIVPEGLTKSAADAFFECQGIADRALVEKARAMNKETK